MSRQPYRTYEAKDVEVLYTAGWLCRAALVYLDYMGNYGDGVVGSSLNWIHRNHQRIGVAVANSPNGPWRRFDQPLVDTTPGFYDALCCNNPSVNP